MPLARLPLTITSLVDGAEDQLVELRAKTLEGLPTMPVSPNSRDNGDKKPTLADSATPEQSPAPDSSADQKRQTSSSRKLQKQNLMRRFMRAREDAQLAGLIRTEPKEAIGKIDERVKHDDPKLIERAIKQGWAVPDEIKPELVAELTAIVTDDSEEASDKTKVAAFRALLAADQAQHDRDTPKTAKQTVNVSVQTNIAAVDILRQSMRQVDTAQVTPAPYTPQITEE